MMYVPVGSKSEIRRLMPQLEDNQAEKANSPLLNVFVPFKPSTDWIRPTHTGEGNLLYSDYWFKC